MRTALNLEDNLARRLKKLIEREASSFLSTDSSLGFEYVRSMESVVCQP